MPPLTRTSTVLHRLVDPTLLGHPPALDQVLFAQDLDDPDRRPYLFVLPVQIFQDLGEPETITVTIEPGDLLSE
jgi:hypothetical protein